MAGHLPSPGLEPPLPPLVVIPEMRVCSCGARMSIRERQQGHCDVCSCRSAMETYVQQRNALINPILDRHIPASLNPSYQDQFRSQPFMENC